MTKRSIDGLLNVMWEDDLILNPQARKIHDLFADLNDGVVINDHTALRTFNLDKIARPFLEAGDHPKGDYRFETKKRVAKHFERAYPSLLKVLISELLVAALSDDAQVMIRPGGCRRSGQGYFLLFCSALGDSFCYLQSAAGGK